MVNCVIWYDMYMCTYVMGHWW